MPHVGPVSEGRTYFCPRCGALYAVKPSPLSKSKSTPTTKCVVCLDNHGQLAYNWIPTFKLIQRPEDA
jgi:hypothetical protein